MLMSSQWWPICGHYFWNNDNGATTWCRMFGFAKGTKTITKEVLRADAMPVGNCREGEPLTKCTAGENHFGDLEGYSGACRYGKKIGVTVSCYGTAPATRSSCKDEFMVGTLFLGETPSQEHLPITHYRRETSFP